MSRFKHGIAIVAMCGLVGGGFSDSAFAGGNGHVKETIKHARDAVKHAEESLAHAEQAEKSGKGKKGK